MAFCIRRTQSPASATKFPLSRIRVRTLHTSSHGRNEPFNNPQLCRRWIHSQSLGSVFLLRPGTCASWRVSTSLTSKPCASNTSYGGIQYTPVLSSATDSTCRSLSHSTMRCNSGVVAPSLATSRPLPSLLGAHTQWSLLPRSIPATLRRMSGNPSIACASLAPFGPLLLLAMGFCPFEHDCPGRPLMDSALEECCCKPR